MTAFSDKTPLQDQTHFLYPITQDLFNLLLDKAEPDVSGTILSADIGKRLSDVAIYIVYKEK